MKINEAVGKGNMGLHMISSFGTFVTKPNPAGNEGERNVET
ncbi:hypothetical protein VQ056_12140 [Paenibacillus sp. JTLBN-2024]